MTQLIIWEGNDPIISVEHAHEAHANIKGSRLEIFDGIGHYPHVEAPERFVAMLSDFIESTLPAQLTISPRHVLGPAAAPA